MHPVIKKVFLLFPVLLCVTGLMGQSFRSAYFLENSPYRHQMNPAFMASKNYVGVPFLSAINVSARGNVGLRDFLYKFDDPTGQYDLTTFMSPTVSKNEFLSNLHPNNTAALNLDLTFLSFGFEDWGGFNTVDLSWRSDAQGKLPYELFEFMKAGSESTDGADYHIRGLRMRTNHYFELAFGHARKLNKKLTTGVSLKVLLGAGNLDATIDRMDISMAQDQWVVTANGEVNIAVAGAGFETSRDEKGDEIEKLHVDHTGLNGWGLAIDLGATYQLRSNLSVSAAITQLGFIRWKNRLHGKTLNNTSVFDGFDDVVVDPDDPQHPKSARQQMDALAEDLKELVSFYDQEKAGGWTSMPAATIYAGANYRLPFEERLWAGLLTTTEINGPFSWFETRLSANAEPLSWMSFSVSYGLSTLASSFGWAINFHPKYLNFFIGTDHLFLNVNPQFIPIRNNLNGHISFGIHYTY